MIGGRKSIDQICIELADRDTGDSLSVYVDVFDNSLSVKWLSALNHLLTNQYHLEKNYCFFGFVDYARDGDFICQRINESILAINASDLGYHIDDHFRLDQVLTPDREILHERFNLLHRYFEDLQGVSGRLSEFYLRADVVTRWHIRQLNLLCHEFESWALSYRKRIVAPDWERPSQLMCWLNAPRFMLDEKDYELFGIDTLARPMGGVYVGVNKAVGKHHWEVFNDEGKDSRIDELTTSSMRAQTEAAGDFDIEWAQNPDKHPWMAKNLSDFRQWLLANGFDPEDPSLTIGHPQVGQVDLLRTFGTMHFRDIWNILVKYLDVRSITTSDALCEFEYHWSDPTFMQQQIRELSRNG